ncbi:dTDP-4-dehydrorhamnose 3,5-epimerase [Halomonas sp. C05BenzN]|uniref:dTDP-4-dehydrorhamnose 3,5-epimerase n=1 Tax=Halomonas sp. C05BenzN TaxID=3411041 RepID=UPI003B9425CC
MKFLETELADAWLIEIEPHGDQRGFFARTMCEETFRRHGLESRYVQQNTSYSSSSGTLRGLHFQKPPHAEAKLVRCLRGKILDVIVDIRRDSPTYLRHQGFELTGSNRRQLYVPPGFAHSFITLCDDVEVSYLVSADYAPEAEDGLRYDDAALDIHWPIPVQVISSKDESWPLIRNRSQLF